MFHFAVSAQQENVSRMLCFNFYHVTLLCLSLLSPSITEPIIEEIHGYHFHTYFFQSNTESTEEAVFFRNQIQSYIDDGLLAGCRLNTLNMAPRGPHPIGSYETCCNKTSMSPALSWFTQNHGNLSVLLHPLTRYELEDHTHRAMFLGQGLPLDTSVLQEDLGHNVDKCLPLPIAVTSKILYDSGPEVTEFNAIDNTKVRSDENSKAEL